MSHIHRKLKRKTVWKVQTQKEARAIYLNLQNAAEALSVGLTLVGVTSNLEKKISTCSPIVQHLLGEEHKLTVAAINSQGQLIQAAITTVPTTGNTMANTPAERGAVRYPRPRFCSGGCLDKITGEDAGYWRENRNAADNNLSLVRDTTSVALTSYDAVSEASVTVLYRRLWTLLLLDPPTPEFKMQMRKRSITFCDEEARQKVKQKVFRVCVRERVSAYVLVSVCVCVRDRDRG